MSGLEKSRLDILRACVPDLWSSPGTLLYIGASPKRAQFAQELKDAGHTITLLEIWEPYARHFRDKKLFSEVLIGDVRQYNGPAHDIAFWWHGPEHIPMSDLAPTLRRLENATRRLVVLGCPWGEYPQGESDGNPHQQHVAYPQPQDLMGLGYTVVAVGHESQGPEGYLTAWREYEHQVQADDCHTLDWGCAMALPVGPDRAQHPWPLGYAASVRQAGRGQGLE